MKNSLAKNLNTAKGMIEEIYKDTQFTQIFSKSCKILTSSFVNGGKVYIAGNGGSAADASHFAAELVVRLGVERPSIPAESIASDPSVITAIANDYGYADVFYRQLQSKIKKEDVFFAISTSGNSSNIIKALEYTKTNNINSILLTGRDGGKAKLLADYSLVIPNDKTSTIQELHKILIHSLCEEIEYNLFFN